MGNCNATQTSPTLTTRICLITALPAETRPWLDCLKLRQQDASPLRLFGSDEYLLLQTGMGKLAAAASVGALLQTRPEVSHLVNIGLAGAHSDIGSVHMAHRIIDVASGAQWFPHLPPKHLTAKFLHSTVHTVDKVNTQYQRGIMFDMEASAIVSTALRYLSSSQIHCLKVVSDNIHSPVEDINKAFVKQILDSATPDILEFLAALGKHPELDNQKQSFLIDSLMENFTRQIRHTSNDKVQLRRLLQRYQAIAGNLPVAQSIDPLIGINSAKALRQWLNNQIDAMAFTYSQ